MFNSNNKWNNFAVPQTDQSEFYANIYNDCGVSAAANSGGCTGAVSVCGNRAEIEPLPQQQQHQQQQYTTSYQLSETPSSYCTNIYRMFPTASEESINFNNNRSRNNYNNNNYNTIINNSMQYEVNIQSNQSAFQNNNNPYNNYVNAPSRHESVYNQQQQQHFQPEQQQSVYQRSNFINNNHNNFVHAPQQSQPTVLYNPSLRQQQQQQQQQPTVVQQLAVAQQNNFLPPPPCRILNYYNQPPLQHLQQQYQQQQQHQQQQSQVNQHAVVACTPSIPCQGNQPWTYAYCYGYGPYSNQEPCQFTQVVDIEDFMNNEKRKERSRDAARCRRSRETEIFTELAQVLPLKKEDVQQLDKASIMRIAIVYLKVRDMLKMFPRIQELIGDLQLSDNNDSIESGETSGDDTSALNSTIDSNDSSTQSSQVTDDECTQQTTVDPEKSSPLTATNCTVGGSEDYGLLLKQTLDGFLLILSNDGDITYVSGNISDYLGLSKIDILGQQIWEYAHQCDHAELKEALNIKRNGMPEKVKDENLEESISTHHRDLFVRLKCTITTRGRSINIKSASYKVIHITGHLVVNKKGDRVLVAMGRPIPHPSNIEVPLGTSTFLTKHSLDMKFTYADDKMLNLLGYKPEDLLEKSLFDYHHGVDSDSLMTTFKNVLSKGQGETCRYRFLGKYGGYCWIVTQATIVYDKLKPQSVVCVNFVISDLEKKHEIYSLQQYQESQKLKVEDNLENLNEKIPKEEFVKDHLKEEKVNAANDLNISFEKATSKVESTTTTPPTQLKNNNNNQKINNNKISEDINNKKPVTKQEQKPTINKDNNNNNNNNEEINKPKHSATAKVVANRSISPVLSATLIQPPQQLATVPHCPTTTVTHTIFSKIKTIPKFSSDKGPKTVTSSLILSNLPTTTSTQSILQQHQSLNVATRAPQSVTASVFSPLPPPKLPITTATAAILAKQPQSHPNQQHQQQQPEQSAGGQETGNVQHQQDMNKGYLSFAEDATELTMLKEEPDDLSAHLVATNAVDACMPLDESGPLFGEMLVGFGIGSYGSLLPDDINSLDSNASSNDHSNNNNINSNNQSILKTSSDNINNCSASVASPKTSSPSTYNAITMTATSSHNLRQSSPSLITTTTCATNNNNNNTSATTASSTNIDPFINYRDESNDTNCSQHLLSPSVTSKSPEGSSLPSLCSPNSLSQEDEFSYYTMNVDDMDDLTMRAPYIPMNEQDDLPLLTSDDYMWSSGNAFTPEEFSLNTKDSDNLQALQINQSLNYQQQQFTQQQTHQFSNSLCSSPASTVSSMSPSPIQQQQNSQQIFSADSSELAALLCGTGNGALSILQDATNFTNSLNLNSGTTTTLVGGGGGGSGSVNGNSCSNQNNNSNNDESGVGLTEDLDSVSVASSPTALDHHQQLQQHCLQQFQEQLQQQRQQQHQQLLSGLNINCKKEKFSTANNSPSLTPNLCDTIEDTFDNVYSKNSNLDCWNEFLQIGTNENANATTTTQQHQGMENLRPEDCKQQLQMQLEQQQQQTQNIIINAVPLITIQTNGSNNKNVLIPSINNQQEQQQQLVTQNQQSNTKTLTKVNTIKVTPITSTATIKIIENKKQSMLQQQSQQHTIKTAFIQATPAAATVATALHGNNKRHLSATQVANNTLESKRLKSNNTMDLQNSTTSQLLQQLITTPQQQQPQGNVNTKNSKGVLVEPRWSANENQKLKQQQQQHQHQQKQLQQQQQKQSNSVLKNLLISGCDKSNLDQAEIINIDDASRSSMQSPELCLSTSSNRPLQYVTPTVALLRNYRHNPWIGAPGNLPSPTSSLITNEDSNPPGLTPCDAIDSASDSGIDDMSLAENMSPLKRPFEEQQNNKVDYVFGIKAAPPAVNNNMKTNKNKKEYDDNNDNNVKIQEINKVAIIMEEMELANKLDEDDEEEDIGASICKRKRSISYLDSSNPLMTPFLMDLCNDDYHMNTKEYLQANDIENVLNEWPADLV